MYSVNLKPGGIIEPLLKIVNVLRMRSEFGVAHSDKPARHGYTAESARLALFIAFGEISKKVLCA